MNDADEIKKKGGKQNKIRLVRPFYTFSRL